MNILFVSHRLPFPPNDGARLRAFRMIRHLGRRGDVTVASLARSAAEREAGAGLIDHCRRLIVEPISSAAANVRMLACLARRTPSSMGYFWSPTLKRRIDAELRSRPYGLVVVHSSSVAPYVEDAACGAKILDFVDMDSQKWLAYGRARPFPLSLGYRLEGAKLQAAEAAMARKFDVCTCITSAELETLRSLGPSTTTGWFPNGVDVEYFAPSASGPDAYDRNRICFVGRMDYYPNVRAVVQFCRQTLPLVRREVPDARFSIVGADPVRSVRRLAELPGVEVTGTVPDVRPYLGSAAVSVAPLEIARGMQNKILEAMSMGVPVVASRLAAAGIDARPGRDLLVADGPEETAAAVVRLLCHPDERAEVSRAARQRVEQCYTWARAMDRFDDFVDTALARSAEPAVATWGSGLNGSARWDQRGAKRA